MVICFAIAQPLPTPPSLDAEALTPALRSKIFQNFRLSSAAVEDVSLDRLESEESQSTYPPLPASARRGLDSCEALGSRVLEFPHCEPGSDNSRYSRNCLGSH